VLLSGVLSGAAPLYFVGDGRIDLSANNTNTGAVTIYGAEVRLIKQGRIENVGNITLGYGGTLFLDDIGTHDSETGGSSQANRIGDDAAIDLQGGTLTYHPSISSAGAVIEKVGQINVTSGQNSVQLFPAPTAAKGSFSQLRATKLERVASSRGTLHFSAANSRLWLDDSASGHNVNPEGGDGVIPWATAMTGNWQGFVKALGNYHEGAANTWNASHNVRMTANQVLDAYLTVNSLILGGGSLNLNGRSLTINSGGLIASGSGTRTITGSGSVYAYSDLPLYVHAFGNLSLTGGAWLQLQGSALVKSQGGTLTLGGNIAHWAANVYIHQGMIDLQTGALQLGYGRITIGDGGGNATLKLAPDRWDQIFRNGAGPNITLNGTPYDPRGPEYGGDQAILRLGGNTKQHLANLHIENRGTIDWVGGEASKANILWIENLTFSGPDAQLFMRNWYEYEDILLVRKTGFSEGYLPQIVFDGYQNYETTYRQWDKDYWQITPRPRTQYLGRPPRRTGHRPVPPPPPQTAERTARQRLAANR